MRSDIARALGPASRPMRGVSSMPTGHSYTHGVATNGSR